MYTRLGFTTLALLLFTACGDNGSNTSDTDADSTGAADSTGTTPDTTSDTDATTDTAGSDSATGDTTGDVPTTGVTSKPNDSAGDDTSDTDATTDATTEGETTDPVDPEIVSGCEAYCARWTECGFPQDEAECTAGCVEDLGFYEGACKDANKDMLACATALTCEQLLEGPAEACAEQEEAVAQACQGSEEEGCSVLTGAFGDECDLTIECEEEPTKKMLCTGETCTCTVGDEKVGECQADEACMDFDALEAKGKTCCGF